MKINGISDLLQYCYDNHLEKLYLKIMNIIHSDTDLQGAELGLFITYIVNELERR